MDVKGMCLLQAYSIQKIETDFKNTSVWFFTTQKSSVTGQLSSLLSRKERQYALNIQHKGRQSSYIVAHAMLRLLLSFYSKNQVADSIWKLSYNAYGKPTLQKTPSQPAFHFSISYSGDVITIAVSSIAPIGIDLEHVNSMKRYGIPWFIFSDDEKARLENTTKGLTDYLALWTLKEAVAKAMGLGMSIDFCNIETTPDLSLATITHVEVDAHLTISTRHTPLVINNQPCSLSLAILPTH